MAVKLKGAGKKGRKHPGCMLYMTCSSVLPEEMKNTEN